MKNVQWLWFVNRLFFQYAASLNKYFIRMWDKKDCVVFNTFLRKIIEKSLEKGRKKSKQLKNMSVWKWIPLQPHKNLNRAIYILDRFTHTWSAAKYTEWCKKCWKAIYLKYIRWAMQYLYKKPLKRIVKDISCILEKQVNLVSLDTIPILSLWNDNPGNSKSR